MLFRFRCLKWGVAGDFKKTVLVPIQLKGITRDIVGIVLRSQLINFHQLGAASNRASLYLGRVQRQRGGR